MSDNPRYTFNLSLLLLLCSLAAFVAALLVAEAVLNNFGTWQEWVAAGLGLHVLAEIL